jgi:hypothetical protein
MILTQSIDCCHDGDSHDHDCLRHEVGCFPDEDSFTTVTLNTLKYGYADGGRVVDASGKCWRIAGLIDLGAIGEFWTAVLSIFIDMPRRARYQLEDEGPIPFADIRDHVCAAIQDYSIRGIDEEAIPGKPDSLFDHQELIDAKTEQCRLTTNMDELIAALKVEPSRRRS